MFGSLGGPEILLIAVLALLLFGPRKLPQIGRSFGKALAEFRGATHEFKKGLEREVELENLREASDSVAEVRRDIANSVREVTRPSVARGTTASKGGDDGAADQEPTAPPHGDESRQS